MHGMAATCSASGPSGDSIDTDCACIKCGHNLRALRRDGVCPECGEPTRSSLVPGELGFASLRALLWTRRGTACWILAFCVSALVYLNLLLVVLGSAPFWDALSQPGSVPYWVSRVSGRAYSYACFVTVPLQAAAVILIVCADPSVPSRRRWLAGFVAAATLASAGGVLYTTVRIFLQLPTMGQLNVNRPLSYAESMVFQLVVLVAWLTLLLRFGRGQRLVCGIMWVGLAVLALQLAAGMVAALLAAFGTHSTPLGGGVFEVNEPPPWEALPRRCLSFCFDEAQFPAAIVLCLGLWAYLRLAERAIRVFRQ